MSHLLQQSVTFHFVFMGFLSFSLQTAIFLNSVNQLICVMVKSCVFFLVRTEFLNIYTRFGFKGLKSFLFVFFKTLGMEI
jgi:hypothetical protein